MTRIEVSATGAILAAERHGAGPPAILLHAGVADRRMWTSTVARLAPCFTVVAYDRRGFGETTSDGRAFRHIDDLAAVVETIGGPATLIGCSQGGRIAIDFALAWPERVQALVLVGSALSGFDDGLPDPPDIVALNGKLEAADARGDLAAVNAIEAHMWLDGPREPEGRVSGRVRDLFLAMNGRSLDLQPKAGKPIDPPPAIGQLGEIACPTLVICGDLDFPDVQRASRHIAATVPGARHMTMAGTAHLPNLERPQEFDAALAAFLEQGA